MADKKIDRRKQESYVRAPYESSKKKNKVAQAINNVLMLGYVTVPKFKKDPPSLEQATKDGKPTKYEATGNDLERARKFEDAAKKMGVNTKEGAIAHNRSTLIQSTNRSPWSFDKGKGNLSNLIDASNLPTSDQMKIAEQMKRDATSSKPKNKKTGLGAIEGANKGKPKKKKGR